LLNILQEVRNLPDVDNELDNVDNGENGENGENIQ
jgi:hypothetical protein